MTLLAAVVTFLAFALLLFYALAPADEWEPNDDEYERTKNRWT